MNEHILKLSASCKNNPTCVFRNEDIEVELSLMNNANHAIGMPVIYLRKKGVYCLLIDNQTNNKTEMGISLTPPSIRRTFTKIAPGQKIILPHTIYAGLIHSIQGRIVDLTARFEINGMMEIEDGQTPVEFTEVTSILIQNDERLNSER